MMRLLLNLVWLLAALGTDGGFGQAVPRSSPASSAAKRAVTVADSIEMTHLADERYDRSLDRFEGRVAHFSPDAKRFVIVLRKGNLQADANVFSMLLFRAEDVFKSTKPELIVKMSSTSNRFAIKDVKWLADSETIAFLGENPNEVSQVYTFNIRSRLVTQRTSHNSAVVKYDITGDGRVILFIASPPRERKDVPKEAVIIDGQTVADVLAGDCAPPQWDAGEVFLQRSGQAETRIPTHDAILLDGSGLALSPSGQYALIGSYLRGGDVPAVWNNYRENYLQTLLKQTQLRGRSTSLGRYLLLDAQNNTATVLVDAPISGFGPFAWAQDAEAVYLRQMNLPLDVTDPTELQARGQNRYDVRVTLPDKHIQKISSSQYPAAHEIPSDIEVTLEEDLNTPPSIFVSGHKDGGQKSRLLDLNPQFAEINLGHVLTVSWKGRDGTESQGGLYLPPKFVAGKRYPLIIQTHGFSPDMRFSMDGLNDWTSAFAARPLAAAGFIVLQCAMFGDNSPQEGSREMARYEGAIEYLDREGLIDRDRVGIAGFSRTVFHVAYTLTHSDYRFGAATLVDGFDGGYFQYLLSRWGEFRSIYGASPFGKGLANWNKNSPSFSLDRVTAPVRLLALRPKGVLDQWEWYAGLALQGKPVEFTFLPDRGDGNNHLLIKPWERRVAQQGLVDWFRFWLQDKEDPDPDKNNQYSRWRELREEFRGSALIGGKN